MTERRTAAELLRDGVGLLDSSHLAELGLSRRAIEAVHRKVPVVLLEGFTRPLVRVSDYLAMLEDATYCDRCGNRVPPSRRCK